MDDAPATTWFDTLKTLLLVTGVAALIWLFAEARSLSERTLEVQVSFTSPPTAAVEIEGQETSWTGSVRMRLEGSRAALDEAAASLTDGVPLPLGSEGVPNSPGEQVVDLRDALRANPPLDRAGVTIAAVEPPTVTLRIEPLVTEEAPVQVALPGVETSGEPTVSPVTASLTLPRRLAESLEETEQGLTVVAQPSASAVAGLPAGGPHTIEVRLTPPPSLAGERFVRIEPRTATVTFTVRSRTDSIVLPSTPVWPALPPTDLNRWRVTLDPMFLNNVRITGPGEVIERIRRGELRAIAYLPLSTEELEQGVEAKAPAFLSLPDSVTVEGGDEPVRLTIEEVRNEPPAE